MKQLLTTLVVFLVVVSGFAADIITQQDMERIYQEVRTPVPLYFNTLANGI